MSWIPSESLTGSLKLGMNLGVSHWDPPLPEQVSGTPEVHELRRLDKLRFANVLSGWAEVDGGRIVDANFGDDSDLVMGSTTVRVGKLGVTFRAISLPVLRGEPQRDDDRVTFTQTAGGATGVPLPRPVPHAPFVQWQAPIVWTTLVLTIRADGSSDVELTGASAFPRHWVYDTSGRVAFKTGLADQSEWLSHSFGQRTPWGDSDRKALVLAVESELERQMSGEIMRGGDKPEIRRLPQGAHLSRQGEPGSELYLVLDGVLSVEVDGQSLGQVGPGAVLGERALLEGGLRTSTLTAVTPVSVAVAAKDQIDLDRLRRLSESHRREEQGHPVG
ncbi:MAG: cyclic nucleotide-binding domain-containing protein [Nocardioidaceae bacterium]